MSNVEKIQTKEIGTALSEFYLPYAAYVLQTRAIPDARDGLKSGARFILYSQKLNKITYDNRRQKGVATISAAMHFNPHGDSSIWQNAARLGQPFALRYPLMDCQGQVGTQMKGRPAAPRYLEMRSNKIAHEMTGLLDKNTIDTWKMNYTDTAKYPTVLPTKFPFSLVNGNTGIGVGCASSIPQFNLKEVSNALIKLLYNPEIDFEEIYCPIDFATGAIIINEAETKESLKNGTGKAAIMRAVIEYNEDTHELAVKELPYQTFTASVMEQIQTGIIDNKIIGIENFFDGTDKNGVNICIKLTKTANPSRVVSQLYKETSLQGHFSINMTMLDNGVTPRVFTWKEMMEAYLSHLKDVEKKSIEFDLKKIQARINILNGYLIALEDIDNIVKTIKQSKTKIEAISNLIDQYGFNELQAKSVLGLELQRLVSMEKMKIEKEKDQKVIEETELLSILNNEDKFNKVIQNEIQRISNTYGDSRRTALLNLDRNSEDEDAPIEEKNLVIHLTNKGNIVTIESTSLMKQKRGGKGSKIKLLKDEYILSTVSETNLDSILAFSNSGKVYSVLINELPVNAKINTSTIFELQNGEQINFMTSIPKNNIHEYIIFTTKHGMVKKTLLSEYNMKSRKKIGVQGIKFKNPNDEIINIALSNGNEKLGLCTRNGRFLIIDIQSINAIGRLAIGVIGIKIEDGDFVISSNLITEQDTHIVSITNTGMMKKTPIEEFMQAARASRGSIVHKLKDNEFISGILPITKDNINVLIVSNNSIIKISTHEIRESGRVTSGTMSIKLNNEQYITNIIAEVV